MSDEIELSVEEIKAQVGEAPKYTLYEANVPALFAAHMQEEVIPFKIGQCSRESQVTLQPMDGDKLAAYMDCVSRISTQDGVLGRIFLEPNNAEAEIALLGGTVKGGVFFYDKPAQGGGTIVEQTNLPPAGPAREKFFRGLTPAFRRLLVHECKRVNGLNPEGPN